MKLSDFQFDLPSELVAQKPSVRRVASRLLCVNRQTGEIAHRQFVDILDLLQPEDLLVANNTQVIPARLLGHKSTGGKIEVLIERILDAHHVLAHVRSNKKLKEGLQFEFDQGLTMILLKRQGDLFTLEGSHQHTMLEWLERIGHMPLPPYIQREDIEADKRRYQTVYASEQGAVAAPTAGLHFDEVLLDRIREKGVDIAFVTLHVGAGTFQPVKVDDITQHKMHSEWLSVSEEVCRKVKACKARGGRVIAVGTTSVRSLETAAKSGEIQAFIGETDIFIYPGYQFNCVDALLTNFHLPGSTLIMLVSAFAGYDLTLQAYQVAIQARYRFFSYGDAMFID